MIDRSLDYAADDAATMTVDGFSSGMIRSQCGSGDVISGRLEEEPTMRSWIVAAVSLAIFSSTAPVLAQEAMDLMAIADTNQDGKVTPEEYQAFSEQGWSFVSQGQDKVKVADLDQMAQMAFIGISPDAEGFVTRQMYIDAIPARFEMFDQNKDGSLNSDELNGRAPQG
jgi:hypothetical protein